MSLVQLYFFGECCLKKMSLVQMFKENVISTDVQYILFLFYVDPLLD